MKKLYTGDNLIILRQLDAESINLIYLDPPFNSNRVYEANKGGFNDTWRWDGVINQIYTELQQNAPKIVKYIDTIKELGESISSYLTYMAPRLLEMHRILKNTGSIYYHCDPTAGHYVKLMLDCIFGKENFRNEIVWCYKSGGATKKQFAKKHDNIYFYSKSDNWYFNPQKEKSYMGLDYNTGNKNIKLYDDNDGKGKYNLVNIKDWFVIGMLATSSKERTGYPTQKPLELLDRIIKASSREGDVVLDPFCGSGTALVSAERLNREWIGIDINEDAIKLVEKRLKTLKLDY